VIRVEVPWTEKREGADFSVELSHWCKDQGLINRIDYNWHYIPDQRVTIFNFEHSVESYATLFALRWAGAKHEI
jgi:hypothetical protein